MCLCSRLPLAFGAALLLSSTLSTVRAEEPSPLGLRPAEETVAEPPAGTAVEDEAPAQDAVSTDALPPAACNEQSPQEFLVRGNYVRHSDQSEDEREARRQRHQEAIRYRTEQYGYFRGFGQRSWNDSSPRDNAEETTFFGLPVTLNRRVIPALACVEEEIRRTCADTPYEPQRLSGLRTRNTFHNDEVSNHVYGIAIDIDPDLNTCCGCTRRWRRHPLCRQEVDSIFERMAMPECWVHVFERYGFYWLGHDELQDTMHFEFLADPDAIRVDERGDH